MASTRVPRAVLLDAAGTLIELRRPVGEVYARVAREYGVDLPARRLEEAFGRILRQAPPRAFPEAAAEEIPALERGWWRAVVRSTFRAADSTVRFDDFDAAFAALFEAFSDPKIWRARTGVPAGLAALRGRGVAAGVVSNFDLRLHELLADLDLDRWLDTVVLPADAGVEKPDPAIFALALTRLGVEAADAVFVGDSPERDLAGARAAGLQAIDVATLATFAELPDRLGVPDRAPETR